VEPYAIHDRPGDYERLQALARMGRAETVGLLARAGVGPGMRCLDLGCGAGAVTLELARMVGPDGHVTGVDADAAVLDVARADAAREGLANVEFLVGDVLEVADSSAFDVVSCRLLLHHVSRPVELLRRMWAAVAPGGAIAVEDADFDGLFCDPPNDGFEFYRRLYAQVVARRGGDASVGRKLHRYFVAAGIPDPRMSVLQRADVEGEAKRLALWTLEATAEASRAEGLASAEEIDSAVASLASFTAQAGTLISQPRRFQLWSRRSPA
jgi:ubiquinone/menaquinone biosynthesis C-methylase UbiE